MNYPRAIELTPVNFDRIVKDTPFTIETLIALHAGTPYLRVVKEIHYGKDVFMIMPPKNLVTFGFPDTTTGWFDVMTK